MAEVSGRWKHVCFESTKGQLGYVLWADEGGRGKEELSGPVPCLCYLVLSALPRFIETSYTQVLKEGLGPKSELKPMGVTFVCQSLTVCLFP